MKYEYVEIFPDIKLEAVPDRYSRSKKPLLNLVVDSGDDYPHGTGYAVEDLGGEGDERFRLRVEKTQATAPKIADGRMQESNHPSLRAAMRQVADEIRTETNRVLHMLQPGTPKPVINDAAGSADK